MAPTLGGDQSLLVTGHIHNHVNLVTVAGSTQRRAEGTLLTDSMTDEPFTSMPQVPDLQLAWLQSGGDMQLLPAQVQQQELVYSQGVLGTDEVTPAASSVLCALHHLTGLQQLRLT